MNLGLLPHSSDRTDRPWDLEETVFSVIKANVANFTKLPGKNPIPVHLRGLGVHLYSELILVEQAFLLQNGLSIGQFSVCFSP